MAKEKVEVEILTDVKKSLVTLAKYTTAIGAATLAVRKAINISKDMVAAYAEQEKAETKLSAALKATGGALGITENQLHAYARELQNVTTFGDEAIIGAQALMTTFTQVGKDVFPQAIEAAADMSEMFGQDLQQSVIQLGTALNDPIAGVGRLKRIGISFTEDQRESIKTFVEQNDIMSAQKVILQELNVEFGGMARAAGESATGSIEQLKNALSDLSEQGGQSLLEWIKPAVGWLTDLAKGMGDVARQKRALDDAIAGKQGADFASAIEAQTKVVEQLRQKTMQYADEIVVGNEASRALILANHADYQKRIQQLQAEALLLVQLQQQQIERNKADQDALELSEKERAERERLEEIARQTAELWKRYGETEIGSLEKQIELTEQLIADTEEYTSKWDPQKQVIINDLTKKLLELRKRLSIEMAGESQMVVGFRDNLQVAIDKQNELTESVKDTKKEYIGINEAMGLSQKNIKTDINNQDAVNGIGIGGSIANSIVSGIQAGLTGGDMDIAITKMASNIATGVGGALKSSGAGWAAIAGAIVEVVGGVVGGIAQIAEATRAKWSKESQAYIESIYISSAETAGDRIADAMKNGITDGITESAFMTQIAGIMAEMTADAMISADIRDNPEIKDILKEAGIMITPEMLLASGTDGFGLDDVFTEIAQQMSDGTLTTAEGNDILSSIANTLFDFYDMEASQNAQENQSPLIINQYISGSYITERQSTMASVYAVNKAARGY